MAFRIKQGRPLSPMLFGIFIDGRKDFLADNAPAPVVVGVAVSFLLYAYDLVSMFNSTYILPVSTGQPEI